MKKVLILSTENCCRSIMAELLINYFLKNDNIEAYSSGTDATNIVNPEALKALKEFGIDASSAVSKNLKDIEDIDFDLVVTLCDNAKENCPASLKDIKTIHVGFENPSGKKFFKYLKILNEIKETLLPIVKKELYT